MLTVGERHLEAVLSSDALALPLRDLLEVSLAFFFELSEDVHHQLIVFLVSEGASCFALDLWQDVNGALHAGDRQSARHK